MSMEDIQNVYDDMRLAIRRGVTNHDVVVGAIMIAIQSTRLGTDGDPRREDFIDSCGKIWDLVSEEENE